MALLDLLGRRWTLRLIWELAPGEMRAADGALAPAFRSPAAGSQGRR